MIVLIPSSSSTWVVLYDNTDKKAIELNAQGFPVTIVTCTNGGGGGNNGCNMNGVCDAGEDCSCEDCTGSQQCNGGGGATGGGGGTQYDYFVALQFSTCGGNTIDKFIRVPKPNSGLGFYCDTDGYKYELTTQSGTQNYDVTAANGNGVSTCTALNC